MFASGWNWTPRRRLQKFCYRHVIIVRFIVGFNVAGFFTEEFVQSGQPYLQPNTQLVVQPITELVEQPIEQLFVQPIGHPYVQPNTEPIEQLFVQPNTQPNVQQVLH